MNEPVVFPKFRWLILISSVLGYISMQIAALSFAPIIPQIVTDLKVPIGVATNLMTAFFLSSAIAFFVAGAVCDRFGIMPVIFIGLLCAAVPASLMPWIGRTYAGAFWARLVEGCSAGFLISAMGPIIAVWFPPKEKGLSGGLMGASVSVGSAIGVIGVFVGGFVAERFGNYDVSITLAAFSSLVGLIFVMILPKLSGEPNDVSGL